MNTLIALWLLSCFCSAISYFLDFAFGFPMSEKPNQHAVFFRYTLFLAKRRMKKQDADTYELIKADALEVIRQAKPFMSYEYALGYCAVCTNVWVTTFIYIAILFINIINPLPYFMGGVLMIVVKWLSVVLASHIILRKYLLIN